ncbi:uncharacterized protein SCHCODRAFT_02561440 [Schizophyllum commune H4-8]|nr:uncharacterized protein SCHCODRAFT_02561440 [Schizophyllum commune H4-8]KAI5899776.1 hypothetical protein SCHCODRAFT_02561440 [Schizophyllum commune H4-8]
MLVKMLAPLHLSTSLCQQCSFSASTAGLSVPLELIRAHILPTEKDECSIRNAIASETSVLSGIDEQISCMQRQLDELRAHRETFRTHIERKHTLLSPIRRLPPELTGRILEMVIVDTLRQKGGRSLVKVHPLLQVCHRWRNIVLGMPYIWADIALFPYCDADWDDVLADRVERSRPLSLHLTVTGTEEAVEAETQSQSQVDPESVARWQHFSDIFNSFSDRWRSVCFDTLCPPTPYQPTFSRLTSLYLRRTFDNPGSPSLALFANAPALVNVRIQDVFFAGLTLPWRQLRHLTVCLRPSESTRKFRDVLEQCVFLVELACTAHRESTSPSPLIVLPNLRCLTLRHSALRLLWFLWIPKIREVHLLSDASVENEHQQGYILKDIITSIPTPELTVITCSVVGSEWQQSLLPHLARISHLRIIDEHSDNQLESMDIMAAVVRKSGYFLKITRLDLLSLIIDGEAKARAVEELLDSCPIDLEVDDLCTYRERLSTYARSRGCKIYEGGAPFIGHPGRCRQEAEDSAWEDICARSWEDGVDSMQ